MHPLEQGPVFKVTFLIRLEATTRTHNQASYKSIAKDVKTFFLFRWSINQFLFYVRKLSVDHLKYFHKGVPFINVAGL